MHATSSLKQYIFEIFVSTRMTSVQTWNMFLVTVGGERNGPFGSFGCN